MSAYVRILQKIEYVRYVSLSLVEHSTVLCLCGLEHCTVEHCTESVGAFAGETAC